MLFKDTYFVRVFDQDRPGIYGYGECGLFAGLSPEANEDYEAALTVACQNPEAMLPAMSSLLMGFETALMDYRNGCKMEPFDRSWSTGKSPIEINGLIWMGDKALMVRRVAEKIGQGFRVLKLKIGGIDFESELDILRHIRREFSAEHLELRLDANGSFKPAEALERLNRLSAFDIHSIEQPVAAGNWACMARLCKESPIAIALDEDLIGCRTPDEMRVMLDTIRPHYIILKPTLCGGFASADAWIAAAEKLGIGWWATSALESNIGLNAIARWLQTKQNDQPQGLGTGQLYDNNIQSPLFMDGCHLNYTPRRMWQMPELVWH